MTLRRQVSLVLRFGWLVDHGQQTCTLTLDAELCVAVFWRFCYFRQSGGPASRRRNLFRFVARGL